MKLSSVTLLLILVLFSNCLNLTVLNTVDSKQLKVNGSLVSALGYYKLTLESNCSLVQRYFNQTQQKYSIVRQYRPPNDRNYTECKNVSIDPKIGVINNFGDQYVRFNVQKPQFYLDDASNFLVHSKDSPSIQNVSFRQPQNVKSDKSNIKSYSKLPINQNFTNSNGWKFMFNKDDVNISKDNISKTFKRNQLYNGQYEVKDKYGESRYALLPGMTLHPRAGNNNECPNNNFENYFYRIDDFYPVIRMYDPKGYQIAQFGLNEPKAYPTRMCPPYTFDYRGRCVSQCPNAYKGEIRGNYGRCVLACEIGSIVNNNSQNKLCISNNYPFYIQTQQCPDKTQRYRLGCFCKISQAQNKTYYDRVSKTCVLKDQCPSKTVALNLTKDNQQHQGICAQCPQNCQKCSVDKLSRTYLICENCSKGFKVQTNTGQCVKSCNIDNCQTCSDNENCILCQPTFALVNNKCVSSCFPNQLPIQSYDGKFYCHNISESQPINRSQYVGGFYNNKTYAFKKNCPQNQLITGSTCSSTCPTGFKQSQGVCVCGRFNKFNFGGGDCQSINGNPIGMYANKKYMTYLNCDPGCLQCNENHCLRCPESSVLIVTKSKSYCQQKSPYFSCNPDYYTYNQQLGVCYPLQNGSQHKCSQQSLSNCDACPISGICLICQAGYLKSKNVCVKECNSINQLQVGRNCISKPLNCFDNVEVRKKVNYYNVSSKTLDGDSYSLFTRNGSIISQDPILENLSIRNQLEVTNPVDYFAVRKFEYQQIVCECNKKKLGQQCVQQCPVNSFQTNGACQCSQQYLDIHFRNCSFICQDQKFLIGSSCVSQCPSFSTNVQNPNKLCKCDDGFETTVNGTCIFTPESKDCLTYEKRFLDLNTKQCVTSCGEGFVPQLNDATKTLECIPLSQTPSRILKIDSSVYKLNEFRSLYYFIIDGVVDTDKDIKVLYEADKNITEKVGQSSGEKAPQDRIIQATNFKNKTYIAIASSKQNVALDFRGALENIKGIGTNDYLGSGIYGVNRNQSHIEFQQSWLAIVAYCLSIMTILIHAIYIGNYLIYKVDNLLIFIQSIFFFTFIKLFVGNSLSQYYWGFSWAHWRFFPNYFQGTIPQNYYEGFCSNNISQTYGQEISNSYRLGSADSNFIRNAGHSFSLLITFIGAFLVVILVIFLLKKICKKSEVWYKKIAKDAIFAAIQFVTFNIFYWAVAHLLSNGSSKFDKACADELQNQTAFRRSCSIAACVFIGLICIYAIVRACFNKLGGLYMLKRIIYATILAGSVYQILLDPDSSRPYSTRQALVAALVGFQLLFVVLRFLIQRPKLTRQIVFILAQGLLMIISFLIMYLWSDKGLIPVFVSIFIFVFLLFLIEDLIDVYNDARDEFYDEDVGIVPGAMQKIPDTERYS